ncbi:MAG: hypothetical protein OEY23_09600 [Acidimicrobiia bacterium]|nr:hypothetical protein [Acidimicrobiia bacterium]
MTTLRNTAPRLTVVFTHACPPEVADSLTLELVAHDPAANDSVEFIDARRFTLAMVGAGRLDLGADADPADGPGAEPGGDAASADALRDQNALREALRRSKGTVIAVIDGVAPQDGDVVHELVGSVASGVVDVAFLRTSDDPAEPAWTERDSRREGIAHRLEGASYVLTRKVLRQVLETDLSAAAVARSGLTSGGNVVTQLAGSPVLRVDHIADVEQLAPRARGGPSGLVWFIAGFYVLVQLVWAMGSRRSLFQDEALYLVAGSRTFSGFGVGDGFLGWVTGSLLYPIVSTAASLVGGAATARFSSAFLLAGAAVVASRAAFHFYGPAAATPTAFAFLASGPVLFSGHFINHDIGAVFMLSIALWASALYGKTADRRFLVVVSLAWVGATLFAYASALTAIALALIALRRSKTWFSDAFLLGAVGLAPIAVYVGLYSSEIDKLVRHLANYSDTVPLSGEVIAFEAAFLLVAPLVLGVWTFVRDRANRVLNGYLLFGLLLMPLIHIATNVYQASGRHTLYGAVLAAPLMGRAISQYGYRGQRALIAMAASFVVLVPALPQQARLGQGWLDMKASLEYLTEVVEPGDVVLTEEQWPVAEQLLRHGRIDNPWDVYSLSRLGLEEDAPDVCDIEWFVEVPIAGDAAEYREAVDECATFVPRFRHQASVTWLQRDLRYQPVETVVVVWQNEAVK